MMCFSGVRPKWAANLGWLYLTLTGLLLAQPKLEITVPKDGTTVNPGSLLTVTVAASPATAFQQVIVVGQDPIGFSRVLTAPPYQFTIPIPSGISPGPYLLTAHGSTAPGQDTRSRSINIVVERADSPIGLQVYPPSMQLSPGRKGILSVTGVFSDGKDADLTKASRTVYTSDKPSVVTVQAEGIVTAVAPGSAKVDITYGKVKIQVPVTVERTHER